MTNESKKSPIKSVVVTILLAGIGFGVYAYFTSGDAPEAANTTTEDTVVVEEVSPAADTAAAVVPVADTAKKDSAK